MPEKLAICLLASEVEPLSKTGGLADVAGALTRYLHDAGHDVRLFTPAYDIIDRVACRAAPLPELTQVPLTLGPYAYEFSVLRASLARGAPVYLIDCPALYARGSIYTSDPDEHLRFLLLPRAALIFEHLRDDLAAFLYRGAQKLFSQRCGVWKQSLQSK